MASRFYDSVRGIAINTVTDNYHHFGPKEWLITFRGGEADIALRNNQISDPMFRLWNLDQDPEGSVAGMIHKAMVILLERGESFLEVYTKIQNALHELRDRMEEIKDIVDGIIK